MTKMERKSCWGTEEEEERDVKRGVKLEITGLHMGSAVSHVQQPQTPNSLGRTIYRFVTFSVTFGMGWNAGEMTVHASVQHSYPYRKPKRILLISKECF